MGISVRFNRSLLWALPFFLGVALVTLSCQQNRSYPQPETRDGLIRIPTTSLTPGTPFFYSTPVDDALVNLFVVRVKDRAEAYLDECKKCYVHEKGYRGDTGYVECAYCNVKYPVESLSEGLGSCCPVALPAEESGGFLLIRMKDVRTARSSLR